ncbi:MAG: aminoacyl-tRNA hydrolase [Bacteroidales bacterium]|nr:aminoacyl-tRNA hydrolase [Bacteroidales bacterium]
MKYLIVGLGNIGAEYKNTRHNIGFDVVDAIAKDAKVEFETLRYAQKAEVKYKGRILILIKPTTFMNLSGKAVKYWLQKENISIDNSLTIVDDLAIPTGALRMKKKGGAGGHNGLTDIIQSLGTDVFPRLRFGIGDKFTRGKQVDFVLGEWSNQEMEIIEPKIDMAVDVVKSFVTIGIDRAMNGFNKK